VIVAELSRIAADMPKQLEFRWPLYMASIESYDLVVANHGAVPVKLVVGPAIDMRSYVLPYAVGTGVEVGPGLRPHVLPSDRTDVSYIEQQHPHEWLRMYNHRAEKPSMPAENVLARYRVGSAVQLETAQAGSLDFVFSNHVFEHLANPVQVLTNWLSRLKPGGAILGVIPDPRYTFDCRQAPTTLDEALAEEQNGGHEIPRAKYERWCRFTEPRHTPEGLIERGYSIHVNYFTPEGFQALADLLKTRGQIARSFVATAPNNKDFAFAMWKSGTAVGSTVASGSKG
jgi:SAM-dependent methyltransferase